MLKEKEAHEDLPRIEKKKENKIETMYVRTRSTKCIKPGNVGIDFDVAGYLIYKYEEVGIIKRLHVEARLSRKANHVTSGAKWFVNSTEYTLTCSFVNCSTRPL